MSSFSYSEIGATAGDIPDSYNIYQNRIQLGRGERTWEAAVQAIQNWRMFDLSWVKVYPPIAPIEVGTTVAVLASHLMIYSLNASRIVYTVDESALARRFGFAYGTLDDHAESGEERFTVEWNQEDDAVWYDILAFSRPRHWAARIGYPISRHLQRKFARDSKQAMLNAVRVGRRPERTSW